MPSTPQTLPKPFTAASVSIFSFIPEVLHDGIRAGTGTADLSAYFQCAIDSGAKLITLPAGVYYIDHIQASGRDQVRGLHFQGAGREATFLKLRTTSDNAFDIVGPPGVSWLLYDTAAWGFGLSGMTIDGSEAPGLATAINVENVHGVTFNDLLFRRCNSGVRVANGFYMIADSIWFLTLKPETGVGFLIDGIGEQYFDNIFADNEVPRGLSFDARACIEILASTSFTIDKGSAQHIRSALIIAPPTGKTVEFCEVGPYFADQCSKEGFLISPTGGLVRGIRFAGTWAGTCDYGFRVTGAGTVDSITFSGIKSKNNVRDGVLLEFGNNLAVRDGSTISGNGMQREGKVKICGPSDVNPAWTRIKNLTVNPFVTSMAGHPVTINGATYVIENIYSGDLMDIGAVVAPAEQADLVFNKDEAHAGVRVASQRQSVTIADSDIGLFDLLAPYQAYGINVAASNANGYHISGNNLTGNTLAPLVLGAGGSSMIVEGNRGIDDAQGLVTLQDGVLTLPLNSFVYVLGLASVNAIGGPAWVNRRVTFIPMEDSLVFTAGDSIGNSFTAPRNRPVSAVFDGTKWYLG
ncbi:hypothetical protein AS593_00655 [Caulobacter vibrioides]|nr:hypothetical protein AS593_00655 [Caulobacter vibrioides]